MTEQTPSPPVRTRRGGGSTSVRVRPWVPWAFLAPVILFFLVFFIAPFGFVIYVSFHTWNMLSPMQWVGLSNYSNLLADPIFRQVVENTALFTIASLVVVPGLAILIALLLSTRVRFHGIWRTLFFSPMLTSQVAIALIWGFLLNPIYGPIDALVAALGFPVQQWLYAPNEVLWVIVAISTWQTVGYYAVIYLAGLQSIPNELYEAASLDGATPTAAFRHVTLPMLKETHLFVWVILTINSLQIFIPIYILTGGGPANSSNVILLYIYNTAFHYLNMGSASAMSVVLFLVILLASFVEVGLIGRRGWQGA